MKMNRFQCPIAVHLILQEQNNILLLQRNNTGFADGMWGVPAGCIDGNESVTDAMIREAKEETGILIKENHLKVASVMHRRASDDWESVVFFFVVTEYEGRIENKEPHKCSSLKFFPLNNLPENLIPYVKEGIRNSLSGISFSEFGWKYSNQC